MADLGIIKFRLGEMNFCMYSDQIVEIIRYTGVRAIPRPLPYVLGIIQLRKRIAVVVDLRKRLGLASSALTKDTAVIISNLAGGRFGLVVDAIADFRRISAAMILPPISLAGFPEQLLHGVLTEKDDILLFPDFDKIFASYINIRLVPISSSEKIAFQYRFTPGALSRTVENILLQQPRLDPEIARELPRALCLPSPLVHKLTTYHSDFQPRPAERPKAEPRRRTTQQLKAGDEQYVFLAQRLRTQQKQHPHARHVEKEEVLLSPGIANLLTVDPPASVSERLEDLLRLFPWSPEIGRKLAHAFRLAPVTLTKYVTYYASFASLPLEKTPGLSLSMRAEERSSAIVKPPLETRLQQLFEGQTPLFQTLQALHAEQYPLTRSQFAQICAYYQLSSVKLAKLCSFFPEYAFVREVSAPVAPPLAVSEREEPRPDLPPPKMIAAASVSAWLHELAATTPLAEDRDVRQVAARLRVPTCRLSKLRSYYGGNHE